MRKETAALLVADLARWLRSQPIALARHNPVAGAIDYMLKDWTAFTRFLADVRICLANNQQHRRTRLARHRARREGVAVRGLRPRRRARRAFMDRLIGTAKLNEIDPQAWLADVLARIADTPQHRLGELLP